MPSNALEQWKTVRSDKLDEIEAAHAAVEGIGPGRRYATQQINQAYVMMLSSQFQGFCRDLHTECAEILVRHLTDPVFLVVARHNLTIHRALDRGNPTPGTIGADFNRLGLRFWNRMVTHSAQNERRRQMLDEMNSWRNAIAHQDFDPGRLGGRVTLQLRKVQDWRRACNSLANSFESVLAKYLQARIGSDPW